MRRCRRGLSRRWSAAVTAVYGREEEEWGGGTIERGGEEMGGEMEDRVDVKRKDA